VFGSQRGTGGCWLWFTCACVTGEMNFLRKKVRENSAQAAAFGSWAQHLLTLWYV